MYDYLFLDLKPSDGAPPARALAEQLEGQRARVAAVGGDILGLFAPQLGWRSRQAAVLVRWSAATLAREQFVATLSSLPAIGSAQRHSLAATARPDLQGRLKPGGIHVHRWFEVETAAVSEFVALSVEGWADFETRFDAAIFGLFAEQPTHRSSEANLTRLLLITRYGDHGVWETSRDPSTAAMAAFMRRQRLTRETWAASTLTTPFPAP